MQDTRQLIDLHSVGPKTVEDFRTLGITRVEQLAGQDAESLYDRLCKLTERKHDICCLDVFRAAIKQAENPNLPDEQCRWYYWSKVRKAGR